ncbi:MAG: hypothetical protein F6K50_29580, partial [Moorea sp. SIO3I7]|nr:hypothetical protein [Moorena sp. SIO3I7]
CQTYNFLFRQFPHLPISLSPYLPISPSPYLPISLSPYLPISLSPYPTNLLSLNATRYEYPRARLTPENPPHGQTG